MKKIIVPALFFAGWMALLQSDLPVKDSFLPALGRFLSPFLGVWQSVTPKDYRQALKAPVHGTVKILFDERAIPHVYADNTNDALYAQGYLHAANRLFAMDITTRAAAGRLSELLGARTIPYDRKQRERGFEYSAIEKAKHWESFEENRAIMDAYVRGVNDYIHSLRYKDWPIEYKLLSHAPAEWSATQSALVVTSMAISLCLGEDDVEFTTAKQKLSPADFAFLYPEHNPRESPVIPAERKWDFKALIPQTQPADSLQDRIGSRAETLEPDLNGSNNWAVAAAKTKHGYPIVANDPHLNLTLPNIWYEMEMHTPDMHVHGVTLPGLPFVILGFNDSIAWGSTNSGQDVLDWYRITWQDSLRFAYKLDGQYVPASLRPEQIDVRGARPVIDTIRYTRWGPVSHLDEHKDMAMKWIGHQKASINDVDYLQKINSAGNLQDYREAVASFQYPAQNKVFGSVQGDIAISVAGVMPIRPPGLGESVTPGDATANDWQGYVPFDQAPYIINPRRGWVSSANQAPADTTYPYPLIGKRTFEDYRGRMVNLLLDTMQQITPEDMETMQQNNFSLHASEMLPVMLNAIDSADCLSAEDKKYIRLLARWNDQYHRDSLSPVLFELWYNQFEKDTWDELDTLGLLRPEAWRFIAIAQEDPDNKYFDLAATPDKKETLPDIVCQSFHEMVAAYVALPQEDKKNWGSYKKSKIPHLARFPHFGIDFISASGGKHIINAMNTSHGPSWRMVAEMSDPPKAWVNYPGGQSGDPASPHYRDFVQGFFDGQYYEVTLRTDPGKWTPVYQMTLQPK